MQINLTAVPKTVQVTEQPLTQLLGAQLKISEAGCELTLAVRHALNWPHRLGSVASCLTNNAIRIAGGLALRAPMAVSEFGINCIRPDTSDTWHVRAECLRNGPGQALCRIEILAVKDGVETLAAAAQARITALVEQPRAG